MLEHEELFPTAHERVLMVRNHQFDPEGFRRDLEQLRYFTFRRGERGARWADTGQKGLGARFDVQVPPRPPGTGPERRRLGS